MTSPVVVRPATPGEARALAALHLASAVAGYGAIFPPESPPPTVDELTDAWTAWLADPRTTVLVADQPERPRTGVVVACPDPADPAVGHVARLYVAPDAWGRGIGRRLHDACLGVLRRDGFTEATLWVLEDNRRARSWYERLGWRPTDLRTTVDARAGIDDVGYRRATAGDPGTPPGDP